jgi:hypothetical protein
MTRNGTQRHEARRDARQNRTQRHRMTPGVMGCGCLITRRSRVQIPPPLRKKESPGTAWGFCRCSRSASIGCVRNLGGSRPEGVASDSASAVRLTSRGPRGRPGPGLGVFFDDECGEVGRPPGCSPCPCRGQGRREVISVPAARCLDADGRGRGRCRGGVAQRPIA